MTTDLWRAGPFSESARVGDLLFLAGQIGEDKDGNLVPGGIKAEAEQMMLNIKAALARRGLAMEHVVKCTVFLADIAEWGAFNEVYKKHFSQPYPARSALGASGLVVNARVEMECIAGYLERQVDSFAGLCAPGHSRATPPDKGGTLDDRCECDGSERVDR